MLFAVNFCRNVALLLLISPGITTSAGPRLFLLTYSTGLYIPWSADAFARCDVSLPAVGDGLPNVGCARLATLATASAAPTSGGTRRIALRRFIRNAPVVESRRFASCAMRRWSFVRGRIAAVVAVELGDHFVHVFVDQRLRHAPYVGAGVRAGGGVGVGDHAAIACAQREPHVHRNLVHPHHRIAHGLGRNQ